MLLSDTAVEPLVALVVGMAGASWSWKRSVSRRNTARSATDLFPGLSSRELGWLPGNL